MGTKPYSSSNLSYKPVTCTNGSAFVDPKDEPPSDLVPLVSIPGRLLESHPGLKLRDYDQARPDVCSNAVAIAHNACRVEMANMWTYVLPAMESRKGHWTEEDGESLSEWWAGFARFALTSSFADEVLIKAAQGDIIEDYDANARAIGISVRKLEDRLNTTLVNVGRKMTSAVDDFKNNMTEDSFALVVSMWEAVAEKFIDTYTEVENTLDAVDSWRQNQKMQHKGLEKEIGEVYTARKRWDDAKRAEMIVILTRWVASDEHMRAWIRRNMGSSERKAFDKWEGDFQENRQRVLDRFKVGARSD